MIEEGFPLDAPSDTDLDEARVTLWARVCWDNNRLRQPFSSNSGHRVWSHLVFKRNIFGGFESEVECIHLAVYAGPIEELVRYYELSEEGQEKLPVDFSETTKFSPLHLSPEEQFRALRSYAEGIASIGVRLLLELLRRWQD